MPVRKQSKSKKLVKKTTKGKRQKINSKNKTTTYVQLKEWEYFLLLGAYLSVVI